MIISKIGLNTFSGLLTINHERIPANKIDTIEYLDNENSKIHYTIPCISEDPNHFCAKFRWDRPEIIKVNLPIETVIAAYNTAKNNPVEIVLSKKHKKNL